MHPDWTLRVPVARPRGAAWLDGVVILAAMAAVWFALHSVAAVAATSSAPALAALAAAAAAISFLRARARKRAPSAVSAIRMDRDGAFHLRMRGGWQPAEWTALWRGPRWLTLRARLPAVSIPVCNGGRAARRPPRHVTFTVWQDALPPPAWRRACLLANRRLCRTPAARGARAS